MSLGVNIGRLQRVTLAQGAVSPIYGITKDAQGMRPSALNFQVIRNAGTSAHSVLVEGSEDIAGPYQTLATITDQLVQKFATIVPTFVRATATTSTGGTVDFLIKGAVN
jgi:hypothetical protein